MKKKQLSNIYLFHLLVLLTKKKSNLSVCVQDGY